MKNRRLIILFVSTAIIGLVVYFVLSFFINFFSGVTQVKLEQGKMPEEYFDIFSKETISKLVPKSTLLSDHHFPISQATYDSNYLIIVSKLNIRNDIKINEAIIKNRNNCEMTPLITYSRYSSSLFDIRIKEKEKDSVSCIELNFGDIGETVLVDSNHLIFNGNTSCFSLILGKGKAKYIVGKSQDSSKNNIAIILYKKNGFLYILIISANNKNVRPTVNNEIIHLVNN